MRWFCVLTLGFPLTFLQHEAAASAMEQVLGVMPDAVSAVWGKILGLRPGKTLDLGRRDPASITAPSSRASPHGPGSVVSALDLAAEAAAGPGFSRGAAPPEPWALQVPEAERLLSQVGG